MSRLSQAFKLLRLFAMIALVAGVAACARTPEPGVGNLNASAGPPGSQQEFLVTVGDRVFFDTDSSVLSATAKATLDKQAVWLNRYTQYKILIGGHADERGTREYNIALGARRAAAVVAYLESRGVSPSRITSKSYGKERPVATCNNQSCWSQNRRAVTNLVS